MIDKWTVLAAAGGVIVLTAVIFLIIHYFSVIRLNKKLAHTLEQLETSDRSLREIEERYRMVVDNSLDAVLLTAPDGNILSANPTACRMFGRTEEEICRCGRAGVVDVSDPRLPSMLEERARTGNFKGELTFIRKDGTKFPGEITSAIFKDKDGFERTSMIIRDITERKLAEEALKRREAELNESQRLAHIGSWDWDARTDAITWSPEYYRIYNIDPAFPTPNYQEHLKAYKPESARRLDEAVKKAMETGEPYALELELASSDAERQWIFALGAVKRDPQGNIIGLRGTAQNITERKRAEEVIRKLNTELDRRVGERTAELEQKNAELERMNRLFVGRELKMIELKKRIAGLENEIASLKEWQAA